MTNTELKTAHAAIELKLAMIVASVHGVVTKAEIDHRDKLEAEMKRRGI